jgi:hypothetical protein
MTKWGFVVALLATGISVQEAGAQVEAIDQGTLVIRVAEVEVAREQFALLPGRRGGLTGSSLRATASYPGVRPRTQYTAILERNAAQTLAAFQVERGGDAPERTVAELTRDRLTVRTAAPARESAREYPGGPDLVALDDSVYALWVAVIDLATEEGAPLRVVYPRTGWRGRMVATRTRIPGAEPSISLAGDIEGRILLDADGRFSGLILPAKRVEVLRQSESPPS